MKDFHAANVAILCREPITIKSVFRIFNVSLFELSQLKILLRSLLISVWRIDKSTAENARLVCTVSRYDPITPSLINLHWLPVTHRIEFKIAMLVHKCIYGVAPQYLLDLIKIKESSRYQLRSYRGILLMDNTYRTKKTLGDRAFENAAPKVWNRLPLEIRQCQSLKIFKVLLKTLLFKLAFY